MLQEIYNEKVDTTSECVKFLSADCIDLEQMFKNPDEENSDYIIAAHYKLFLQGLNEDDYAELLLNINDTEHWIELKEKDKDYRPITIKLSTKT